MNFERYVKFISIITVFQVKVFTEVFTNEGR